LRHSKREEKGELVKKKRREEESEFKLQQNGAELISRLFNREKISSGEHTEKKNRCANSGGKTTRWSSVASYLTSHINYTIGALLEESGGEMSCAFFNSFASESLACPSRLRKPEDEEADDDQEEEEEEGDYNSASLSSSRRL
jgi:hypothetical protein